jgi:hypothetical protein
MWGYADFGQSTVTGTCDLRHPVLLPGSAIPKDRHPVLLPGSAIPKDRHLASKPDTSHAEAIRSERLGAMRVMLLPTHVCAEPPTGAHPATA